MANLLVDNRKIEAEEGSNLLQVCLKNEIYIPNLCFLEQMSDHPSSCRMCFVEIDGENGPVPACTVTVTEGMTVKTDTDAVRQLQKTAFQLLMSVHDVDCGNCPANKACELQRIARHLKVPLKPGALEKELKTADQDHVHPLIDYCPNRCVLCARCIRTCKENHGQSIMSFAKRGFDTLITFYGQGDLIETPCDSCLACVEICPVGALVLKNPSA